MLVVCSFKRLGLNVYINSYFILKYFETHGRIIFEVSTIEVIDPLYHGTILRSNPVKINRGRMRKIRILMIIDEMKGCIIILLSQRCGPERWGRTVSADVFCAEITAGKSQRLKEITTAVAKSKHEF
jgi:hypothetical protein